ncbi:MAG TPA: ferritin-like domain-containing protein [Herbaspirillum sp.]
MTNDLIENLDQAAAPRRIFLRNAGFAASGFGAIALAGISAGAKADPAQDVGIMQGALALEHEGIAAYQIAGASGLLTPATLKTALIFLGHHQQHRDSLMALISKAGGNPVKPKTDAEYTKSLNLGALKSEGDVVALATRLEQGATNAYAGQIAALQDRKLAHLFGQLATDEAVHWTTLNNALGQPIQAKAYLFG